MLRSKMRVFAAALALALALVAGFAVLAPKPQVAAAPAQKSATIVGVALSVNAKTGEFSTLIAALRYTGLVSTLNGKGQYTVFAPTDAAFAKLGLNAQNISTLPMATVTNILLYHVAHGRLYAQDVEQMTQIRMLNKEFTKVSVQNGAVFINNAQVITPNVSASNGVIHIINSVLLP